MPRTRPRSTRRMIALDGTPNKARLGANAILGVSLAVAKAAAAANRLPLYRYVGGTAARAPAGADDEHRQRRRACRQPDRLPGIHDHAGRRADASPKALRMGVEMFQTLKKALHDAGHNTNVGDEGGFAPNLQVGRGGARLRHEGDREGRLQARRGCRAGARSAPRPNSSRTAPTSMKARARPARIEEQAKYLAELVSRYPIVSIEDGMAEDDFDGWKLRHRPDRQASASWSATTCSSPTSSGSTDGIKQGHRPIRSWSRSTRSAR